MSDRPVSCAHVASCFRAAQRVDHIVTSSPDAFHHEALLFSGPSDFVATTAPLLRDAIYALKVIATVHFVWFGLVIVTQPDFHAVWRIWHTVLFGWL